MNFLNELKKKSKRESRYSLLLGVVCLFCTVIVAYANMRFFKPATSVHDISGTGLEETGRVSIQEYLPLSEFAESDDGSYYYAILTYDADDVEYILPCEVNKEMHQQLEQAIDDINEEIEPVLPELNCVSADFDSEARQYYDELLDYYEITADDYTIVYTMLSQKDGGVSDIVFSSIFIIIFAVITVVCIGKYISMAMGNGQKAILSYARTTGSEQTTLGQLETFYQSAPEAQGVKMGEKWILFQSRARSILLEKEQLVWIYKYIVRQKYMFVITTSKSVDVVFCTADNRKYMVRVKSETAADELISEIMRRYPDVMAGYSKELDKLWDKDGPSAIRRLRQQQTMAESYPDQNMDGTGV